MKQVDGNAVGTQRSWGICALALASAVGLLSDPQGAKGQTIYGDTLDIAAAAPSVTPGAEVEDHLDPFIGDKFTTDDNLYRLPSGTAYLAAVGPNAVRSDQFNTASIGIDGQWTAGRQIIDLDLRADDNRFAHNNDLNNVSGLGKLAWNWRVGSLFSGRLGADFNRSLASFTNTTFYIKDLVNQSEYYAAGRYNVGPRWAVFGGVLNASTTVSAAAAQANDFKSFTENAGIDYVAEVNKTLGFEYRNTNAHYTHLVDLLSSDYREGSAQLLIGYALGDKTQFRASGGYLKRRYDHPSQAFQGFSGDVWRASIQWQPTEKIQFVGTAWRQLQAYLSTNAAYYVSTGESLSPVWAVSDKLKFSLVASYEKQDYLGANPVVVALPSRHDKIAAAQVGIAYTPTRSISLNVSYRSEHRSSDLIQYRYNDNLSSLSATFSF
ncbi:MAG: outer membrane beta-barrel protein [Pseudomonadota bacterium]|nr:outer membrane beta-barrel protein [Pseudomonadota bacterium]